MQRAFGLLGSNVGIRASQQRRRGAAQISDQAHSGHMAAPFIRRPGGPRRLLLPSLCYLH